MAAGSNNLPNGADIRQPATGWADSQDMQQIWRLLRNIRSGDESKLTVRYDGGGIVISPVETTKKEKRAPVTDSDIYSGPFACRINPLNQNQVEIGFNRAVDRPDYIRVYGSQAGSISTTYGAGTNAEGGPISGLTWDAPEYTSWNGVARWHHVYYRIFGLPPHRNAAYGERLQVSAWNQQARIDWPPGIGASAQQGGTGFMYIPVCKFLPGPGGVIEQVIQEQYGTPVLRPQLNKIWFNGSGNQINVIGAKQTGTGLFNLPAVSGITLNVVYLDSVTNTLHLDSPGPDRSVYGEILRDASGRVAYAS